MRSNIRLSDICDGESFFSCSGSPVKVLYTPTYQDHALVLEETGKIDIQEMVQSYSDTTDMSYILARLAAGDASVLNVSNGFYGDASVLTNDHRAALDTVISANQYFDNLDEETRAKFNDNFVEWIQSAGSKEWIDRMVKHPVDPPTDPAATEKGE